MKCKEVVDWAKQKKIYFLVLIVVIIAVFVAVSNANKKEIAVVAINNNGCAEFQLNDQKFSLSCAFENDEYCFFETNYPEVNHCWLSKDLGSGSESSICFYSAVCFRIVLLEVTSSSVKIKISEI